jgi:hypothetical protein
MRCREIWNTKLLLTPKWTVLISWKYDTIFKNLRHTFKKVHDKIYDENLFCWIFKPEGYFLAWHEMEKKSGNNENEKYTAWNRRSLIASRRENIQYTYLFGQRSFDQEEWSKRGPRPGGNGWGSNLILERSLGYPALIIHILAIWTIPSR